MIYIYVEICSYDRDFIFKGKILMMMRLFLSFCFVFLLQGSWAEIISDSAFDDSATACRQA